jgi:hypothetical protein
LVLMIGEPQKILCLAQQIQTMCRRQLLRPQMIQPHRLPRRIEWSPSWKLSARAAEKTSTGLQMAQQEWAQAVLARGGLQMAQAQRRAQ